MNEVYYAILGKRIGNIWYGRGYHFTEGTSCSVKFDYRVVLGNPGLLGFYHTHPHCGSLLSLTDFETMGAWVNAEGRPLLCIIEGTDGLSLYEFYSDEHVRTGVVYRCKNLFYGKVHKNQYFPTEGYMFDKQSAKKLKKALL
jgi:hypothetical protein